jgi:hypothetical protein
MRVTLGLTLARVPAPASAPWPGSPAKLRSLG